MEYLNTYGYNEIDASYDEIIAVYGIESVDDEPTEVQYPDNCYPDGDEPF